MSDILPFRWGQPFRIPRREESIGGPNHFTSDFPELPNNIAGKPFPVWGSIPDPSVSDSIVAAQHISQFCWVKVRAAMQAGTRGQIALLDSNNVPFVDPSIPPHVVAMVEDGGVGFSEAHWAELQDPLADWRSGMGIRSNRDLDRKNMAHWFLRRANDPVPHWVIEVHFGYHDTTGDVPAARITTLDLNFLTTRVGPPAEELKTINPLPLAGIDAAATIWNLWPGNTDVDHNGTPDREGLRRMVFTIDAVDQGGANPTHHLTVAGSPIGASLFDPDTCPACIVFGDPYHDGFPGGAAELRAGGATTTWRPGTHGLGYNDSLWSANYTLDDGSQIVWPLGSNPEDEVNYFMDFLLSYNVSNNSWQVQTFKATGVPSATDRTHYIMCYGLAPP